LCSFRRESVTVLKEYNISSITILSAREAQIWVGAESKKWAWDTTDRVQEKSNDSASPLWASYHTAHLLAKESEHFSEVCLMQQCRGKLKVLLLSSLINSETKRKNLNGFV
jgi:hypothetical protein